MTKETPLLQEDKKLGEESSRGPQLPSRAGSQGPSVLCRLLRTVLIPQQARPFVQGPRLQGQSNQSVSYFFNIGAAFVSENFHWDSGLFVPAMTSCDQNFLLALRPCAAQAVA